MQRRAFTWIWILACLIFVGFSDTATAQGTTITVTPSGPSSPLTFNVPAGNVTSAAQTVSVSSTVATTITVQVSGAAPWLQVDPAVANVSNTAATLLNVRVNPNGLAQGSYQGTFTVAQAQNIVATVFVNMNVSGQSQLSASPSSLTFTANQGASVGTPASTPVTISSTGPQLSYTLTSSTQTGGGWLLLNTTNGQTGGAAISVSVNPAGLAVGTYNGTIVAQSTTTADSTTISVTLTITANATLTVTPTTLPPFLFQVGGAIPASQQLNVTSSGGQVNFTVAVSPQVSWLVLGTSGGITGAQPVPILLSVNPSGLPAGSYQTQVIVTPFGGAPLPGITVTLVISNNPLLKLQTNALSFNAQFTGAAPADQTVNVTTTSGTGNVGFTVTQDSTAPWLTATASGSTTPATLTVRANPAGLAIGTYTGVITVRPSNGDNYSQVLNVTFTIGNAAQLSAGPPLLVFAFQTNQSPPLPQSVRLTTTGQPITFTLTPTTIAAANCPNNWITVSSTSNTVTPTVPADLNISVNTQGMTAGVCAGNVAVNYSSGGSPATLQIPVTVNVSATAELTIGLPVGFGNYTVPLGGSVPAAFIALGTSDLNASSVSGSATSTSNGCAWLFVNPNTFSATPLNLVVQILPACLTNPGTYAGSITINSPTLPAAVTIPVTLTITSNITVTATPAAPGPFVFTQPQGGPTPASQSITLASSATGATFIASVIPITGGNWLQVSPGSGAASGAITLSIVPSVANALPVNTYTAQVSIAFQGSSTAPLTYNVTLNIIAAQTLAVTPSGALNFGFQIGGAVPPGQKLAVTSSAGSVVFNVATTTQTGGLWLKSDVTSGRTPQDVTISIDPTNLIPGIYQGSITITAGGASAPPLTIPVSLTVLAQATPQPQTITNNASNLSGPIAPGELITIKGTLLGPATPPNGVLFSVNSQGGVNSTLAGVRVLFNNTPGTPIFVSANQINVIVPYEVGAFAQVNVVVEFNGAQSAAFPVRVENTSPAIYTLNSTGVGQAAAVNQNNTFNGPPGSLTTPAAPNTVIAVYATGGGQSNPPSVTGSVTGFSTLLRIPGTVTASIGGVPATVEFIGEAPGIVTGVLQINLRVPPGVTGNALPVSFTINGVTSPAGPTVAVQ